MLKKKFCLGRANVHSYKITSKGREFFSKKVIKEKKTKLNVYKLKREKMQPNWLIQWLLILINSN